MKLRTVIAPPFLGRATSIIFGTDFSRKSPKFISSPATSLIMLIGDRQGITQSEAGRVLGIKRANPQRLFEPSCDATRKEIIMTNTTEEKVVSAEEIKAAALRIFTLDEIQNLSRIPLRGFLILIEKRLRKDGPPPTDDELDGL
jgi:hypothetical protein